MLASLKYYQQDQKRYEDHSNFQKISPQLARAAPKIFQTERIVFLLPTKFTEEVLEPRRKEPYEIRIWHTG